MTERRKKESEYIVSMDVFFMETHSVMAKNKKEAFEKARKQVNHGMGEEVTLYEIEKTKPRRMSKTQ